MAIVKKSEKTESELWRRFKSNPALFIGTFFVLIIVIIAFVLVPAIVPEYGGRGNFDLTFGYYDGVPISFVPGNYFYQYYDRVVRYRQSMGGESFDARNPEIWREAYEVSAIHVAILQEMKRAHYTAPEKIVDREVAQLPQFQDNGRFSAALYRQMDDNSRLSLWRQVQDDIAKEHYRSDVTGVLIPEAEGDFISKMALTQRSFDMAAFSVDTYPDAEYEAYMQEHPDLFRSVHLSMITVTSEREARRILDSIKSGERTFEDAATEFSKDPYAERGGDMGTRMIHELRYDIPDETEREKIIALAKGEYSDIVKAESTWSFFRVEEAAQDADASDETTIDRVRFYVRNFERGRMEDWAIAQADNFRALVDEIGFEEALARQGIEKTSFGPAPLNYGNIDLFSTLTSQIAREYQAASINETFWKAAFSTPLNTPSEPVVQGSSVLVLFPTDETEAEESAIENIASMYNGYWLRYMSDQALQLYFMNSPKMVDKFNETYSLYRSYFGAE